MLTVGAETVQVCAVAVKTGTETALPLTVTLWEDGLNVTPDLAGVTV
jgi:hypothetical protein